MRISNIIGIWMRGATTGRATIVLLNAVTAIPIVIAWFFAVTLYTRVMVSP